ncbi:MAG: hypothetical protein RJA57_1918 [Bacteroidota bacterium]
MRNLITYTLLFGLFLPQTAATQRITGSVSNNRNEPLIGATIQWLGSKKGVFTDKQGAFEIPATNIGDKRLIASYVGHFPDTVRITEQTIVSFQLKERPSLTEVLIRGERDGVILSDSKPIKTEQITQTELRKAACCDLAGCFETQTTVQPQTTNVITNAKELRILGLAGVYNQILIDGFPLIQGLTYTYGISSIPGSLVDNIYISKGANSVLQGYEGMSGQINVETKEPDKTDRLFLNTYMNSFLEKHFNINYAGKTGKWSQLTALHTVQPAQKTDRDEDKFLDLPQLTRYLIATKWKYGNEKEWGWSSRLGFRYLNEERIGGQTAFNADRDKGSSAVYGQSVVLRQPEFWTKTGYRLNDQHQFILFTSAFHQEQRSYFGTVRYDAQQTNVYANLQYEWTYAGHDLKTGISYRNLNLGETISFTDTILRRSYAGDYRRRESIPGFFAENTLRLAQNRLTWIAGLRADHHNQFGFRITPRTLLKYDLTPKTILRASIGTGWRTVNLFSENIGLLVSSRDIVFAERLQPEKSLNGGINLTKRFETKDKNLSGYLSMDFYHTRFQNQIFPDYDTDPTKAIVRNFTGTSISNGFQTELSIHAYKRFECKSGINVLDVYRIIEGKKKLLPFNPRYKVLTTFSYKSISERLQMDMNLHWYGKQRLPDTDTNPAEYQRPSLSRAYSILNAQITYRFRSLEVYAGCENMVDFRQRRPIISWQDPFSPYFDTSSVWGPTRGREAYAGIRLRLKKN